MSLRNYGTHGVPLRCYITEALEKESPPPIKVSTKEELRKIIKDATKTRRKEVDLNYIDVSDITDMSELFKGLQHLRNVKIDKWNVSKVTDMSDMFYGCKLLEADLSGWDVSNVTSMKGMFYNCNGFHVRFIQLGCFQSREYVIYVR